MNRIAAGAVVRMLIVVLPVAAPSAAAGQQPREIVRPAGDLVPAPGLEFHRVHVPGERIAEVDLGAVRYLPMPLAEFNAAVARLGAARQAGPAAGPEPLVESARYEGRIDDQGNLSGTLTLSVAADAVAVAGVVPLGIMPAGATVSQVTDPSGGEGLVFADADGRFALRVTEPGEYTGEFSCRPAFDDALQFRLPLVPALSSSIRLRLPPELRPLVSQAAARHAVVRRPQGDQTTWRLELGPVADAAVSIRPVERGAGGIGIWSLHSLRGSESAVAALVEPTAGWPNGELELEHEPGLVVSEVLAVGGSEPLATRAVAEDRIAVGVPTWLEGRRVPLEVHGIAPAAGGSRRLPLVRSPAARWARGGMVVVVDPDIAVAALEGQETRVIPPEAAARWRLPSRNRRGGDPTEWDPAEAGSGAEGRLPAVFHVEQQGPAAALNLTLEPRRPAVDVARVTTVELTPATVLGRAACDLRVLDGSLFDITATIAAGWIIDAVDLAEWPVAAPAEAAGRPGSAGEPVVDWRVVTSPTGNLLRIGLGVAATPNRGLGLRITGHRAGLQPGVAFSTADIDMVRFAGESAESAVIDIKTGPDALVEIAGDPVGWFPVDERLGRLVGDGTLRGRIRAGEQAPSLTARLVRQRPPLDARVEVRIDMREASLLQTFAFTCRAEAGGMDALVVHFSEPMDDGLEWSVASPKGVGVTARRIDPADARRPGGSLEGIAESWLIECSPPVSGPARIRGTRSVPFVGPASVPLAWVESARVARGTVVVAGSGIARPRVVNRRLRELPADLLEGPAGAPVLEFAYGSPAAVSGSLPAAELAPDDDADGRAWAWIERARCWCHESGATECESTFDIENHGRTHLVLSVPAGRVIDGIALDASPVPIDTLGPRGGTLRIPLPPSRRRIELFVRTLERLDTGRGFWRVRPLGGAIDMPVLDREISLALPPGLQTLPFAAGYRPVSPHAPDGWERLLGARPRFQAALADRGTGAADFAIGFREFRFAAASGDAADPGVWVLTDRSAGWATALVSLVAGAVALATAGRRPRAAAGLVLALSLLTLMVPAALVAPTRAALWSCLGAAGLASLWRSRAVSRTALVVVLGQSLLPAAVFGQERASASVPPAPVGQPAATGGSATATRVFITTTAGDEMALVPEPLFRLLADASAAGGTARIAGLTVLVPDRVLVDRDEPAAWRVVIDLDSDAGGTIVIDQSVIGGTWTPPGEGELPAGVLVRSDGRRLRVTSTVAGRRRLALDLVPGVRREGGVIRFVAGIPVAPVATLRLVGPQNDPVRLTAGALACERAAPGGPFLPAPEVAPGIGEASFDISGGAAVQLACPFDPSARLATRVQVASSRNDLVWDTDACRLDATFELDGAGDLLRSFLVRSDERLTDLAGEEGAAAVEIEPVAAGRWLVRLVEPAAGPVTLRLEARMPLTDPVGVFDLPTLQLAAALTERPQVRLSTAAEFEAVLDVAAAPAEIQTLPRQAQRVSVVRRSQSPRGAQSLAIDFAADRIGLALKAQIEATTVALARFTVEVPAGSVIDGLRLTDEDAAVPVDAIWTRTADDRVGVIVQQPRSGRFRLDVRGRIPGEPAVAGSLPILRGDFAGGAPLLVSWRVDRAGALLVGGTRDEKTAGRTGTLEIADPDPVLDYRLLPGLDSEPGAAATDSTNQAEPATVETAAEPATGPDGNRVEGIDVFVAFDGHGRARGLVRYDITMADPVLRFVLPAGGRLFDVIVDGVEAVAAPGEAGIWEVKLHDIGWPRSVLVLWTRDFGRSLAVGEPVALEPPAVVGAAPAEVIWTLAPPPGTSLRITGPSLRGDAAAIEALVAARRRDLAARFAEAFSRLGPGNHERLEVLSELRSAGRALPLEESWRKAIGWHAEQAGGARVVSAGKEPIAVRLATEPDSTLGGRAVVAAALVVAFALAALGGMIGVPWPVRAVTAPALMLAGIAWTLLLAPAWPGWLLVGWGLVALSRR